MRKLKREKRFPFFDFEKRGISTIVATVMIVLITVAAVTILWIGVMPLIAQSFFVEDADVRFQIQKGEFTVYDSTSHLLSVQVKRGVDESNITKLRFIIGEADGNSVEHVSSDVVVPGGTNVYYFDIGSIDLLELSISPVYYVDGEEYQSQMVNTVEELPDRELDFSGKAVVLFVAE